MSTRKPNGLKVPAGRRQKPNLTFLIRKLLWAELHQLKAVLDAPLLGLLPGDTCKEERKGDSYRPGHWGGKAHWRGGTAETSWHVLGNAACGQPVQQGKAVTGQEKNATSTLE